MSAAQADTPTSTHGFDPAELARVAANKAARAALLEARKSTIDSWTDRFSDAGLTLLRVVSGWKGPIDAGWEQTTHTDWDAVERHLHGEGNVGALLGDSHVVAWDGDNEIATQSVLDAGWDLFTVPAGSLNPNHNHRGGAHTLWALPAWVPRGLRLTGPTTAVVLENGASFDVLAGNHQILLPLSVCIWREPFFVGAYMSAAEAGYCGPDRDGWLKLDASGGELPGIPLWSLSKELQAFAPEGTDIGEPPAGWEAMAGTITIWREAEKTERVPGEGDDELTAAIDELDLLTMIEEAGVVGERRGFDRCGPCEMWLRQGSNAEKSLTVHRCGDHGARVQVWTTGIDTLPAGGYSRLDAFIGLTGGDIQGDRKKVMAKLGLSNRRERQAPDPITPEMFEADAAAAEARGDITVATALLARAEKLRAGKLAAAEAAGETFLNEPMIGAEASATTEEPRMATVTPLFPDGVVPPVFATADAASAHSGAAVPRIGTVPPLPLRSEPPAASAGPLAGLKSGKWLDEQVFAPLEYHVPGIVTEGCGIVAGPPKAGKSWLVLAIALAIAAGGTALGCLRVTKRPVLYLALEDGDRRIQFRSRQLLGEGVPIPEGFTYMLDIPEGDTAVSVITQWLELHPGERPFIVVDTLGKTRGAGPKSGASAYQEDYKAVGDLKKCTDRVPGSGMLIVHHTRKSEAGKGGGRAADFVEELSGTFGLSGAADYAMVLHRDRESEGGVLAVTGRDVIERTMGMTRDPETGLWTLDGGSIEAAVQVIEDARNEPDEESIGDVSQRIVAAVLAGCPNAGDTMSAQDIAAALNTSPARIYKYLQRLSDASRPFISKPSRGRYGPPAPTGSMLPVGVKPPAQPPRQPPRGVPLIGNL